MNSLLERIQADLLPNIHVESLEPHNPVVVHRSAAGWGLLGAGNYAAVFCHPDFPSWVVKVYAPGRPGLEAEAEVYRRLGPHPAFSESLHVGPNFLILKRLNGVTLYDCMHLGIRIPQQVIQDIDQALDYARARRLYPHDVHGRNVMMQNGRGLVVDISDFLRSEPCRKWADLKRAYYWLYLPILAPLRLRFPYFLLDGLRGSYRLLRRLLLIRA